MNFLSRDFLPNSSSFVKVLSIIIIIVAFIYHNSDAAITLPKNETIPAVIVFGDSIVDPGNNNNRKTIAKANYEPYGRDFIGKKPTGRFSNGRIPPDFIAEELGVNMILPAYLDPNLQIQDLLTGVSFASGGSGYDPLTPVTASALSLSDQLDLFKEYISKIDAAVGQERTATILSKSLFIVCLGSNDIANNYFSIPPRRLHYDISAYTDLMVNSASNFFQELYGQGARRIGVLSVPAIGCVPSQRTLGGGIERECYEIINQAARLFNSKLSSQIDSLNKKLPDARLVYLDIYNSLLSLIQNPSKYGFQVANKGCCGTGNIEVTLLCNRYTPGTCDDPSKYIFWDSFHPTEKAYKTLIPLVIGNQIYKFF